MVLNSLRIILMRSILALAVAAAGVHDRLRGVQRRRPGRERRLAEGEDVTVAAAFYPLAFVAERVGGDHVQVDEPHPARRRTARPLAVAQGDRGDRGRRPGARGARVPAVRRRRRRPGRGRQGARRRRRRRAGAGGGARRGPRDAMPRTTRARPRGRRPALLAGPRPDGSPRPRPSPTSWRTSTPTTPTTYRANAAKLRRRARAPSTAAYDQGLARLRARHGRRLARRLRLPGPVRAAHRGRSPASPPRPSRRRPTWPGCRT